MLAQLLAGNGGPKNPNLFGNRPVADSWIRSITTLSAPHDGTTLADIVSDFMPFMQSFLAGLAITAGGSGAMGRFVYDFKLDQWGVDGQAPGESFSDYLQRVMASPLWADRANRDLSGYDLSTKGAAELNGWVRDRPAIYYFSYSTQSTWTSPATGWEYPLPLTNPLIGIFAGPSFMGSYSRQDPGAPAIDRGWWPNDGIVNTRSMKAPSIRSCNGAFCETGSVVRDAAKGSSPVAGAWNWMGLKSGVDHMSIIGWSPHFDSLGFYKGLIDMLRRL
jgi:triacylglycerol lipase